MVQHRGEERDPFGLVLQRLEDHGCRPRQVRDGCARAHCPVHVDRRASLMVTLFENRVVLKCFSGCSKPSIAQALGLSLADLYRSPRIAASKPRIVETYDYTCDDGTAAQKVRYSNKAMPWRIADPSAPGGLRWGLGGRTPRLYREHELTGATRLFVVEGEKAVNVLAGLGLTATCPPAGASTWKATWSDSVRMIGCEELIILADNDRAGEAHAERVAASLQASSPTTLVRVVTFPELLAGGDVVDFLDDGHTADDLLARVAAAPAWMPGALAERRRKEKRAKAAARLRRWRQAGRPEGTAPGPQRRAPLDERLRDIVEVLADGIRRSGRAVKAALAGAHGRDAIDEALLVGVERGALCVEEAPRRARLYGVSGSGHSGPPDIHRVSPLGRSPAARTLDTLDSANQHRVSLCPETRNAETRGVRTSLTLQRDSSGESSSEGVSLPDTESPDTPAGEPGDIPPGTCCGRHAGEEQRGHSYVLACKLCPQSPSYWRRADIDDSRRSWAAKDSGVAH